MHTAIRISALLLLAAPVAWGQSFVAGEEIYGPGGGGIEYRLLATNKTSTSEKEINEAAVEGFEFVDMMGGETLGGNEVVTVMARPIGASGEHRHEYRLLATSRTSKMRKELDRAGDAGFRYVGQSVAETAFGGREVIVILKRPVEGPRSRYLYELLATTRTKTMSKELKELGGHGFRLLGLTVGETALGGHELVSILMLPVKN